MGIILLGMWDVTKLERGQRSKVNQSQSNTPELRTLMFECCVIRCRSKEQTPKRLEFLKSEWTVLITCQPI